MVEHLAKVAQVDPDAAFWAALEMLALIRGSLVCEFAIAPSSDPGALLIPILIWNVRHPLPT
jgi:hypothetical protein